MSGLTINTTIIISLEKYQGFLFPSILDSTRITYLLLMFRVFPMCLRCYPMMWCVITVLVVFAAHHCIAHNLIISLQSGQVRGTTFSTPSGKTFNAWRGIAFAKPPLGDLRFKHPERPKPWDGVLDATKDSKACMNTSYFEGEPEPTYGYSEDCLYVNVYAPIKPNSSDAEELLMVTS
ncbi:unnamed protein product [Ceutorhynchus assimilis]|uniref:Carboxylesterase type B domain-containing protein n=1 Tax=Ceutorhynchus assimilis TaxID=467358 RepID=A0A9N9N0X7_9CUCU|nr:unnamed protein product [Ceutorhynchus assimilis]